MSKEHTNSPWVTYHGIDIFRFPNSTAYHYMTSHVALDADGAPNAYNPEDTGLDYLANAGYPEGGWTSILARNPENPSVPYVQKQQDPFPGFFVSMTSLQDRSMKDTDTLRYLDATSIPYIVFPGDFAKLAGTGKLGDLAMVRHLATGKISPAIVGDIGPRHDPLGEMSIALASNLGGIKPNPRNGNGAPRGPSLYAVFPGSRTDPPWPLTLAQLRAKAEAALEHVGGWPSIGPEPNVS